MSKSPITTKRGKKLPPIHPGKILLEDMKDEEISINGLAQAIRVPANRISLIVNEKRGITADTATPRPLLRDLSAVLAEHLESLFPKRLRNEIGRPEHRLRGGHAGLVSPSAFYRTAGELRLNGWTLDRAERAKDATISWSWAYQRFATGAFVEKEAGVRGHGFGFHHATKRAG